MKKFLCLLLGLLPLGANAALDGADIPVGTVWYLHADLAGMRKSSAARELYGWFEREVVDEVRREAGVDLSEELDRVTAYATEEAGIVVVAEGALSQATRDKLLAVMTVETRTDLREHKGQKYWFAGDEDELDNTHRDLDELHEAAFVSLDLPGKLVVTSQEGAMRSLLDRKGRIAGAGGHRGALLVLSADKSYVQGGMKARHFVDDGDRDWNSNILRSTEEAAFMLAERGGQLAVEAQLKSNDARLTESLGSIINGLISLQAFNEDIEPEVRDFLSSLRVSARDTLLSISAVIDPAMLASMMDH